jgi:hypothetical protein
MARFIRLVDAARDVRLMLARRFHGRQGALPLELRLVDGLQGHPSATLAYILEELHGVEGLLLVLNRHPVGETAQVLLLKIGHHGQIQVCGKHFGVDLFVERFFYLGTDHWSPSLKNI